MIVRSLTLAAALLAILAPGIASADTARVAGAAYMLRPGDVIDRSSLKEVEVDQNLAGRYLRIDEVAGMQARRLIREGTAISERLVEQPSAIDRGDQILILFRRGGLTIEATGIAREDGAIGDAISVMNLSTNKAVTGVVSEVGVIRID